MLLYHGSSRSFAHPQIAYAKCFRDFGPGFYLAENPSDALTMAVKHGDGYFYTFSLEETDINQSVIQEFTGYDKDYLACIYRNRRGWHQENTYDIAIGPTAGGRINDLFVTIRRQDIPFETIYSQLKKEACHTTRGRQWCLTTQSLVDKLQLISREFIEREEGF